MAKDERTEIEWATFSTDVRLNPQMSPVRAIVRNAAVKLSFGIIHGHPFLVVEETMVGKVVTYTAPWHSVASCGWVVPPTIEGATPKEKVLK